MVELGWHVVLTQHFGIALDRGKRPPELVRNDIDELITLLARRLELLVEQHAIETCRPEAPHTLLEGARNPHVVAMAAEADDDCLESLGVSIDREDTRHVVRGARNVPPR